MSKIHFVSQIAGWGTIYKGPTLKECWSNPGRFNVMFIWARVRFKGRHSEGRNAISVGTRGRFFYTGNLGPD